MIIYIYTVVGGKIFQKYNINFKRFTPFSKEYLNLIPNDN